MELEQSSKTVAVLIAVHGSDNPAFFDEALASLAAQTHRYVRVYLFVDGPLAQAHEDVILKYLPPPHVVLRSAKSVGLAVGLNALIDRALEDPGVEYLARMDSDDVCMPQRFERQVAYFSTHTALDVVGSWVIECARPGTPQFHKQLPTDSAEVPRFMLYRNPLVHASVMFRRSLFERGFRYNPSFRKLQDYEFWSRLVNAGVKIASMPEYLLWFRVAEDFYTRRTGWRYAWNEIRLRLKYSRDAGLLRPVHLLGFTGSLLLRVAPVWLKKLAYSRLR